MAQKTTETFISELTIGQLAHQANVNIETVRYYQRIGLIEKPPKPTQGYRRYPPSAVTRIQFTKRAQDLGFTLHEIVDLLSLNNENCDEARTIAEKKQKLITYKIKDLMAMQAALENLIQSCRRNSNGHCAIIEALTGPGVKPK